MESKAYLNVKGFLKLVSLINKLNKPLTKSTLDKRGGGLARPVPPAREGGEGEGLRPPHPTSRPFYFYKNKKFLI